MTIAEVHGKLSSYEHMEDLLTSDVFSTFKYLDVGNGLIPFLKKATRFMDNAPPDFLEDIVEADYVFWPRTTYLNREPDVLIILTKKDKSTISIVIEAKYHSGKSNAFRGEGSIDKENKPLDHLDGDQLAELFKEIQDGKIFIGDPLLRSKYIQSEGNRYLFFLTAHYASPRHDIEETFKVLEKKQYFNQNSHHFYWINWMSIIVVIDEVNSRETWQNAPTMRYLLTDLKALMERKGLVPFYGFTKPERKILAQKYYFWEEPVKREELLFCGLKQVSLKISKTIFGWRNNGWQSEKILKKYMT
ncbi:hypothetical protein RCG17_23835 [Neobacillus sp. PS3-12]|uniref:hypothetical protein n=1 Tax=Neobacillus sp. PS3-12 TaxID=3070677 RepID=UPI0027E1CD48|nr:hypothetical protein [Neobacillus sp. PS3-12]WML52376.1 hypothetical protein RCG17_23835 [Neobacillus sp. PS3-12]